MGSMNQIPRDGGWGGRPRLFPSLRRPTHSDTSTQQAEANGLLVKPFIDAQPASAKEHQSQCAANQRDVVLDAVALARIIRPVQEEAVG